MHQGGPTKGRGEPEAMAVLVGAMEAVERAPRDPLTHGIHAYPARMHHAIAHHVLAQWAEPKARVLDPFCGSGTVVIEARLAGLRTCGVDLNPLGLRIAEIASTRLLDADIQRFEEAAAAVVEASFERVSGRVRIKAPLSPEERSWYQPHVLLELAGLHAEIQALPKGFERRALQTVFSSIVMKFSRQRGETTQREVEKRIGKKVVTGFFGRKAEELCQRWEAFARAAPLKVAPPRLLEGDARRLPEVVGDWRFDLVLSSPPYGGTYDYADHHARRLAWFDVPIGEFREGEIGSRRKLSQGRGAAAQWERELVAALRSIAAVTEETGRIVLLVGDGEVGGQRISADTQLETLAGRVGLRVEAVASQRRPDWRGGDARYEHLVSLRPVARTQADDAPKADDTSKDDDTPKADDTSKDDG